MVKIFLKEPTMNEEFLAEMEAMEEHNRKNMTLLEVQSEFGEEDSEGDLNQNQNKKGGNTQSYMQVYSLATAWVLFEKLI